jgi:hypothetical protein
VGDDRLERHGSDPSVISADAAAKALAGIFLANADRGDNAANDEIIAEMVRRMRILQASGPGQQVAHDDVGEEAPTAGEYQSVAGDGSKQAINDRAIGGRPP